MSTLMNLFFVRTPGLVRFAVMLRFRLWRDFIVRRFFEVAMDDMDAAFAHRPGLMRMHAPHGIGAQQAPRRIFLTKRYKDVHSYCMFLFNMLLQALDATCWFLTIF